jgi:hypothetical protein
MTCDHKPLWVDYSGNAARRIRGWTGHTALERRCRTHRTLLRGDDGPGNFILGDQALKAALGKMPSIIALPERGQNYSELARATQAGEQVGSSAAGEQSKFTACVEGVDEPRHVIVKFSERVDGNPVS